LYRYSKESIINLQTEHIVDSFGRKRFLFVIVALIATILIDTSVVKINDLIDKYFIPLQGKLILFSVNSSLCLLLQYLIVRYLKASFEIDRSTKKKFRVKSFYIIFLASLGLLAALIGALIFEVFYNRYYDTSISISIVALSYGISGALIIWLSLLFFSWYKSNRSLIVFLYFVSMLGIAFNLIMTAAFVSVKVTDRPSHAGEYVGSSGDITGGKHQSLENIYRISSFVSFFSIWFTTAILMNYYREKLVNAIVYWVLLSIPLIYFLITYFYQFFLANILSSYMAVDPVTISIVLGAFLSLSKPIGGLIFGIAFWKISRIVSYERNIRTYMFISGWGIFLIFSANQATTLIISPYPPFGLATLTVLNMGAFLMLIGVYNSARLVSANNELRRFIHKHAFESRLLSLIGDAEMEKEIERTVTEITQHKVMVETETAQPIEFDENELKKYLDTVVREVRKQDKVSE
jgi:hypothetical protein